MSANTKVVLNGEQLLAQSQELTKLMGEYDAMFTSVRTILNEMNDGWSANLSNNFSGKITIAQKGFSKIVELIECGALAAKEAANGFEDMNTILGRGLEGLGGIIVNTDKGILTGDDAKEFLRSWGVGHGLLGWAQSRVSPGMEDNLDYDRLLEVYEKLEGDAFGTNYISEARDILKAGEDLFDGSVSSDTVHTITDIFGGYDEILSKVGFTDGIPAKIIQQGVNNIYGDGENIGTISSSMQEFADDWGAVQEAWKEGNYTEAIMSGWIRFSEGSIKLTTESIYELGTGAIKGVVNQIEDRYNMDLSGLEEFGAELDQDIRRLGKNISDTIGEYVDHSVECVPIVADYLEETAGNVMDSIASGVTNLFESVKSLF